MTNLKTLSENMQVKVFLGFLQKNELKLHLKQSLAWARDQSMHATRLIEIEHENLDYIGIWLDFPLSFPLLKKFEEDVRTELQLYCPKIKLDAHQLYLLTQIFLK